MGGATPTLQELPASGADGLMDGVKLRLCSLTPTKMHGGVFNVDSVPHEDTHGTVCGDSLWGHQGILKWNLETK